MSNETMNKSSKIINIVFGLFITIVMIGVLISLIFVEFYVGTPIFCILWFALLPSVGLGVDYGLGIAFGYKTSNSGWVHDGNSTLYVSIKKTPQFYTRRFFLYIVVCFLFLLLIIRSITYLSEDIVFSIIGIVGYLIEIAIYTMLSISAYKKSSIRKNTINNTDEI